MKKCKYYVIILNYITTDKNVIQPLSRKKQNKQKTMS